MLNITIAIKTVKSFVESCRENNILKLSIVNCWHGITMNLYGFTLSRTEMADLDELY